MLFIYRLYNTEEVQRLGICGEIWINNYIQSMDIRNGQSETKRWPLDIQVWREHMLEQNKR